jgi:hypothetical protein
MDVFICWSGDASRALAEGLRGWLPLVIQQIEPFFSSVDIRKGQRWAKEIGTRLEKSDYGIVCLTPGNMDAPWINYESGALSKHVEKGRVSALLLDIDEASISGPLREFQHTHPTKSDVMKLVRSISEKAEKPLPDKVLEDSFEAHWERLNKVIEAARSILKGKPEPAPPKRSERDLLEELVAMTKAVQAYVERQDSVAKLNSEFFNANPYLFGHIPGQIAVYGATGPIGEVGTADPAGFGPLNAVLAAGNPGLFRGSAGKPKK